MVPNESAVLAIDRAGERILVTFALLMCSALAPCHAQQTTATLLGTVTDSSGAAVPGAKVRVANTATNVKREAETGAEGNYSLPYLPSGNYQVTVSRDGFQAQQFDNVTLQVDQTARVDFTMRVGNVTETINVSAAAALLQTENASVGTVIDSGKIVDLPLNGRNFIQLAQLIPGVQAGTPGSITVRRGRGSVGQSDPAYGSTAASANGSRDTANRFYLDGIEQMDYDAMTYAFSPSVDSLAEFKVQTSTYSAEYGGAWGGQVNMITKGGTNAYHGTLWEFNRNDEFTQSYDAIAQRSVTSPRLNRNQFGANFGGPVFLPKVYHGKDKTFFFFNWESGYAAQGASPQYKIVPTQAQRDCDFSGLKDSKGNPITLKDPLNVGIANNQVPKSLLSPQTLAFLQFEPLPNTSNGVFNYVTAAASAVSWQKNFTGRVDHTLSSKDLISGRYVFNDTYESAPPSGAMTSATTWGAPRMSRPPGRGRCGPRWLTKPAVAGIDSTKLKYLAPPTTRPTTWSVRWVCPWFPGCPRSTGRLQSLLVDPTACTTCTICNARSARAYAPTPFLRSPILSRGRRGATPLSSVASSTIAA